MGQEIYSVILAGKSGARLWPLENDIHPQNVVSQEDDYTLFEQTFIKLVNCVDDKNILCVTDTKNAPIVKRQLGNLREKFCRTTDYKVIEEPEGRGTAPAISLSVRYISDILNKEEDKDPIIMIIPSDQLIGNEKRFDYFIEKGKLLAQEGYIVSFAVKPNGINTNVGYISIRNDKNISKISKRAFKVSSFIEKPNKTKVKELIKNKKTFVNCGIYMFKASVFLNQLKSIKPKFYNDLMKLELREVMPVADFQQYSKLPQISIECALMEKAKKFAVEVLKLDWNDLGYWESVEQNSEKDENGNTFVGNTYDIDSKNTYVYSSSRTVNTIGLDNMFIVETPDNVLVCNKNDISKIKDVKKAKDKKTETNTTVYKPWGYYTVLNSNPEDGYLSKMIYVNPKARLSLQTHEHRSEHWVVISGIAKVIKGSEELTLNVSEGIDIYPLEPHSLQNPYDEPLKVLEIQSGELLSEDDIVRLEDIYGRA